MKILLKWINEYVKVDDLSAEYLADKFLNIGFEVEEIKFLGKGFERVVVGEIVRIDKHSNADKLKVCKVNIGGGQSLAIITAATNVYEGMVFPLALDGAELPCGMSIKSGEIRGEKSEGMMCSYEELGINNDVLEGCEFDGILDLGVGMRHKVGERVDKVLGLDDYVLDVSITANRADCNSIYGLARELSVALGRKLKPLNLEYTSNDRGGKGIAVEIEDVNACSMYVATGVKDVKIGKSNQEIRRRLFSLGLKSINNVVDITNYVLLEVGQPLHAFDADKVGGEKIVIRKAKSGEEILGLDGKQHKLKDNHLLICDAKEPLAIAGVIGGQESAVSDYTKNIILESARFSRGLIRATSRELNIVTDSSKRYEKGVDFYSVDVGRKRFLSLIDRYKIGTIIDDKKGIKLKQKQLKLDARKIETILGIKIPVSFIKKTLIALGFEIDEEKTILTPSFREDIEGIADIVEEVIRFYGYDKIKTESITTLPMTKGGLDKRRERLNDIESKLNAFGAYGIKNFSFVAPDALFADKNKCIKILNPLSEDYSIMRNELVSSMLKTVKFNLTKQNDSFRIYEIDNIFLKNSSIISDSTLPFEQKTLCLAITGENEDFYKLKNFVGSLVGEHEVKRSEAVFLHSGISADIMLDGQKIGCYGKVCPKVLDDNVYILELNLEPLIDKEDRVASFRPLSKYLGVVRDIALSFDEGVMIGEIEKEIWECSVGDILKKIELVDIYQGDQIEKNKKSVAFRLFLQNDYKTLVDSEINEIMNAIIEHLTQKLGAKLR